MRNQIILVILAAVMVGGCYQQQDPRVQIGEGVRSDTLDNNIVTRAVAGAFEAFVPQGIELREVQVFRNKSNLMEIHIGVHNKSMVTRRFDYRVEWLDGNGVVVDMVC